MEKMDDESDVPKTKWPEAVPRESEDVILSISCGNSHLKWATLVKHHDNLITPEVFWRTPHISDEDEDLLKNNLIGVLVRYMPDKQQERVFGRSDLSTELAQMESESKLFSVYVVSTNLKQAALLYKVFSVLKKCRFYLMQGDDFFTMDQGRYENMGVDRLATLTGATHLQGSPALVFDGGTATTYSATDSNGIILGGGIGPGLKIKYDCLANNTSLPDISHSKFIERIQRAQDSDEPQPLSIFSKNTEDAMICDAFQEFALKGRNIISHWLEKNKNTTNERDSKVDGVKKINTERVIYCTGGDGNILFELLKPRFGGVIESSNQNSQNLNENYIVQFNKNLVHYGVADVLSKQFRYKKLYESSYLGQRVAKCFDVESELGDNIYLGTVIKEYKNGGKIMYDVKYDDQDEENGLGVAELLVRLETYRAHRKDDPSVVSSKKSYGREKSAQVESENSGEVDIAKGPSHDSAPNKGGKRKCFPAKKSTVAKMAKTRDIATEVNKSHPTELVGRRVAKHFKIGGSRKLFFGTVKCYYEESNSWFIEYDDGDEEDYSRSQLINYLKHYDAHKEQDKDKERNSEVTHD
mmetsp:Transcript_18108/g.35197  ORF Transcript_18108/g.35197 Transcript_18108/m.35197 type:complete len:583 (+) Transcript_18108:223-1971(+)